MGVILFESPQQYIPKTSTVCILKRISTVSNRKTYISQKQINNLQNDLPFLEQESVLSITFNRPLLNVLLKPTSHLNMDTNLFEYAKDYLSVLKSD